MFRTHPLYVGVAVLFAVFIQYRLSRRLRKHLHAAHTAVEKQDDR